MCERHYIAGAARGEPLPDGRIGARVRVPLSGTPSAEWSRVVAGRLTKALAGHAAIGYLRLSEVVQGADLVLDGVEEREAAALGPALRDAVAAANRKTGREHPRPPMNMAQEQADRIAEALELTDERPAAQGDATGLDRALVGSLR